MASGKQNDIELLAPAGNFESLMAAIQGGADAVYFGVGKLNMRAGSSKNFTIEDLVEIKRISDLHGINTYVTLNTVMYDEDIDYAKEIIDAVRKAGNQCYNCQRLLSDKLCQINWDKCPYIHPGKCQQY